MYHVIYTKQAAKDAKRLKSCGLSDKTKELIKIIEQNPFQKPPDYEKLVGNLQGNISRRINIQHRLVYKVTEEKHIYEGIEYDGYVKIVRMWIHYER